jgi:hypothetical protein
MLTPEVADVGLRMWHILLDWEIGRRVLGTWVLRVSAGRSGFSERSCRVRSCERNVGREAQNPCFNRDVPRTCQVVCRARVGREGGREKVRVYMHGPRHPPTQTPSQNHSREEGENVWFSCTTSSGSGVFKGSLGAGRAPAEDLCRGSTHSKPWAPKKSREMTLLAYTAFTNGESSVEKVGKWKSIKIKRFWAFWADFQENMSLRQKRASLAKEGIRDEPAKGLRGGGGKIFPRVFKGISGLGLGPKTTTRERRRGKKRS